MVSNRIKITGFFAILALIFGTVAGSTFITDSIKSLTNGIIIISPTSEIPLMMELFLSVLLLLWCYDTMTENMDNSIAKKEWEAMKPTVIKYLWLFVVGGLLCLISIFLISIGAPSYLTDTIKELTHGHIIIPPIIEIPPFLVLGLFFVILFYGIILPKRSKDGDD